jgi:ATP-dependent RNA helicase DHX29
VTKSKQKVDYDSDIDPDELQPVYLATKAKLFEIRLEQSLSGQQTPRRNGKVNGRDEEYGDLQDNPDAAKFIRKLKTIEGDILFDQYLADTQWHKQRIELEKDASTRRAAAGAAPGRVRHPAEDSDDSDDEINKEAARIGAEILALEDSDDDGAIADLFASLPITEVDPVSGKSSTVINGNDGLKITIRDFGKTTGVSPRRVLEEACRARLESGLTLLGGFADISILVTLQ